MAKKKKEQTTPTPGQLGGETREESDNGYSTWKKRVERAKKIRENWEREYEVERCENFIIGKQFSAGTGNGAAGLNAGKINLNHTLATIKTILPNLVYQAPKFFIRPKPGQAAPAHEDDARVGEGVLVTIANRHQNLKKAARLAVQQNFSRIAVLKVCYDPSMVPNPDAGEPIYSTDAQGTALKDDFGQPIQMKNPLTGQALTEPGKILREDLYRWEWVDARFMLLPDEGPDQSKWTWVGEEIVVPLEDAKDDDRFPKDLREQLTANVTEATASSSRSSRVKVVDDPDPLFKYYEVYDFKKKRQLMWADGQEFNDYLVNRPLPKGIGDSPYAILAGFTPIIGPEPSPWPYPYVKDWLGPQDEYNIRRQQIMEGAKRSARKFVYDDNTFPNQDEAAKLLQNPQDMVGAKLNDITRPPLILQTPDINAAIYKDIPLIMNDWRIITGQTGARLAGPDADTATEATFVERAANLRDADLQDAVNDWLTMAGTKMYQLVRETLTLKIWVKLRGFSDEEFDKYVSEEFGVDPIMLQQIPGAKELLMQHFGQEAWKPITREELDFDADVTVVPGSSRPKNLEVERRAFMSFLQLLGQAPQLAMSKQLMTEVASMFEITNTRLVDELVALAQKMVQVNANQAGRNQGGSANGGGEQPGAMTSDAALSGMTGGM
jgi:hypothetical protein